MKWLLSHNGKPVRRRVNIAETISDPGLLAGNSYAGLYPVLVTQYYTRQPTYLEKTWTEDRVWASARFRYWLPEGPRDVQWTNKMKRALLGLNPSPSVVYNAVPWTWLIDWFTNVGNLIENVEPGVADRLAADYFYVMREIQWRRTQDTVGFFRDPQGNPFTVSASASYSKFRKTRIKGDPFGFNTNPASLSGVQLAILGALGMSRIR